MDKLSSIPKEPHYAIIRTTSVYIPGDERSRTSPGHGYPASTEYFITYTPYLDKEEWEQQIKYLTARGESFRAIAAAPAIIETTVTVKTT